MTLLDLIFPKFCLGCGKLGRYVCVSCQQKLRLLKILKCPVCEKPAIHGMTHPGCKTRYSLDGLTSFFRYDGMVKKAIKTVKYRFAYDVVGELVDCIPDESLDFFRTSYIVNHTSMIIPIPLHPFRYRYRGFNQAEVIAHALAKRLDIPVRSGFLMRTKKTIPQVDMKDRNKRLSNMKDVFTVKSDSSTRQYNDTAILLVDDVFTTGATLRSAASVLKHNGAKFVWGMTVAQ